LQALSDVVSQRPEGNDLVKHRREILVLVDLTVETPPVDSYYIDADNPPLAALRGSIDRISGQVPTMVTSFIR
jgi:hypothetical protein